MKAIENRNIIKFLILSVVTCGIYGIWFMYRWIRDINVICHDDGRHTFGVILTSLFSLCTLGIFSFCWWYQIGDRMAQYCHRNGIPGTVTGKQLLLLNLLGLLCCGLPSLYAMHIALEATNNLARYHNAYH